MTLESFFLLAGRQRDLDRALTARFPPLYGRKRERMLASPHAFFRGSAPLFYEILAARPDLAAGPAGEGWIVGDMHLENVGAYPVDKGRLVFNLNDFDDAAIGPLFLDVLRLSTSVLLAGRTFKSSGREAIELTEKAIFAYARGFRGDATPEAPPKIAEMISRAEGRNRHELLDGRAPKGCDGRRRFERGARYLDLPADLAAEVPSLLRAYVEALGERAPAHAARWQVEDAAQRVAGTGSLGMTRIAVLVIDTDGEERIVELKEERRSSTEAFLNPPEGRWASSGGRVVSAANAMLAEPPRQLAEVNWGGLSFAARKLFPQEDKLEIDDFHTGSKLDAIVEMIGHLLGAAHARGAVTRPAAPWRFSEAGAIVDQAIEMAGIFEGVYLAYARGRGEQGSGASSE